MENCTSSGVNKSACLFRFTFSPTVCFKYGVISIEPWSRITLYLSRCHSSCHGLLRGSIISTWRHTVLIGKQAVDMHPQRLRDAVEDANVDEAAEIDTMDMLLSRRNKHCTLKRKCRP